MSDKDSDAMMHSEEDEGCDYCGDIIPDDVDYDIKRRGRHFCNKWCLEDWAANNPEKVEG